MSCRVFLCDRRLALEAGYHWKDVCSSVPGARWDKAAKVWTYPATPSAARSIAEAFPQGAVAWDVSAQGLLADADAMARAQGHKTADDLQPIPVTKTQAWQHQRRAFWFAVDLMGGLPDARR